MPTKVLKGEYYVLFGAVALVVILLGKAGLLSEEMVFWSLLGLPILLPVLLALPAAWWLLREERRPLSLRRVTRWRKTKWERAALRSIDTVGVEIEHHKEAAEHEAEQGLSSKVGPWANVLMSLLVRRVRR